MSELNDFNRESLSSTKRLVVKIGSALVTNDGSGLDEQAMQTWVKQMAQLSQAGIEIILVSSGAVAEGLKRLGWRARPSQLFDLQAAAAVGQMGLIHAYESAFRQYHRHTAQVLLTHEDLSNRTRYLNARSTILRLLQLGTIPVVNENDTVVTEEIRFGDNDTLAALVANLIEADLLIILTDQQGMFDCDPRQNSAAKLLTQVQANDKCLDSMASDSKGILGRGGMATKLRAARLAARSGAATLIASGREEKILCKLIEGEPHGTLFLPDQAPLLARKQWLAGHLQMRGRLILDRGAVERLKNGGSSLLSIGVCGVEGNFERGDMVSLVDEDNHEIARGLSNYSSVEAIKIMRQPSHKIQEILGYIDEKELVHRDNLVLS